MAPKKQAKPNGFVLFTQEFMKQQGRKFNSLKDAMEKSGPIWARMSKEKRQPFEDQAKQLRGHRSILTSEGIDVEYLTQQERLKNQARDRERHEVKDLLTMAYRKNELDSKTFFVIHINIFVYHSSTNRYWPAEIAALGFTLKDGVLQNNVFHQMVKSGALPMGYKFEAKQHSDETHLIKIPFDDEPDDNMSEVYFKFKKFLEDRKPSDVKNMPILFADKKYVKVIQTILDTWSSEYDDKQDLFRVFNLQEFFYFLKNTIAGDQVWSSFTFSDRELEKDIYAYVPDIACEYHLPSSSTLYCSQSIVMRYAYTICDNCCGDLNIEYINGQHVPLTSSIPDNASSYQSIDGSRSSQAGSSSKMTFDENDSDIWDRQSVSSYNSISTNMDDNFPRLGSHRPSSRVSTYSSTSSVKSYAGATTEKRNLRSVENTLASLSMDSDPNAKDKGIRTWIDNSTSSKRRPEYKMDSDDADFPPIGRGALRKPITKRPGSTENKF